jgi:P pilus assembly chaperone PapD
MKHNHHRHNRDKAIPVGANILFVFMAAFFALLPAGFISNAYANLSANPIILIFSDGGQTRKDITLQNTGDRPQYLAVTAHRIVTPGQIPEELVADPNPNNVGLLVAPRRIVLNPGEQKIIRVIRLDETTSKEEAWRVHIKPVKVEIEATASIAMVQIGYKALVIARPKDAKANLIATRDGNMLSVKNTGNSNALLRDGLQCDEAGLACEKITGKRLWPGGEWQTELPFNTEVTFKALGPEGEEDIRF